MSDAVNFTVAPVPPLTLNSVFPSTITAGGRAFTLTAIGVSLAPQRCDPMERHRPGDEPSDEFGAARDSPCSRYCDDRIGVDHRPKFERHRRHFGDPARQHPESSAGFRRPASHPRSCGSDQLQVDELPDLKHLERRSRLAASYALLADGKVFVTVEVDVGLSVVDFDRSAAEAAAGLAAKRQRGGRSVDIRGTQIAGIVIARRAKLATRNVKHFADLTAEVVNPWEANR